MFLNKSTATATTTTSLATVVCSRALPITMTVTMAPISVGLAALGQYDMVLPLHLILRDTVRNSAGLDTVLQQKNLSLRCLLRHMPIMTWVLLR